MSKKSIIILLIIVIITIFSGNLYLKKIKKDIYKNNLQLYEYFEDNDLLDMGGKVDLSSTESIHKEKEKLVKTILKEEKIKIEDADKLIEEKIKNKDNLTKEVEELNIKITLLDNQVKESKNQYNKLKKEIEARELAKSTFMINNVPTINQYPRYQTGCESVALTILLKYYNISVTPVDIINRLKKGSTPYYENGKAYGGNPELEFIGNPYTDGYGVYENPIADVADSYKLGINRRNNFDFSEVLNLVKENRPVLVWTSMYLAAPYISKTWIINLLEN